MNSLTKALITLVMVSLVGFTYMSENKKNNESIENSTTVNNEEVSIMNTSLVNYVDKGMMRASWYKSVIVRINDRGPYIPGRQLDLSKAAAQKLGMIKKGVVKLEVEEITLKGINFPVISLN